MFFASALTVGRWMAFGSAVTVIYWKTVWSILLTLVVLSRRGSCCAPAIRNQIDDDELQCPTIAEKGSSVTMRLAVVTKESKKEEEMVSSALVNIIHSFFIYQLTWIYALHWAQYANSLSHCITCNKEFSSTDLLPHFWTRLSSNKKNAFVRQTTH